MMRISNKRKKGFTITLGNKEKMLKAMDVREGVNGQSNNAV